MRYLPLILVLALASTANAAISLYINDSPAPDSVEILVDEILTIQIYSSDDSSWSGILEQEGVGGLSNGVVLPAAGDLGSIEAYPPAYALTAAGIVVPPTAGIQFEMDYSSSGTGNAFLSLWDNDIGWDPGDEVDTLNITVVPEPATIALLALGGLAILKKRRR
jgi:hypothetical protein